MLGLFVSFARSVKQWAWNNVALLVLTGLTYDVALTALYRVDTLQEKHNALSGRVTRDMAYFEQKLNSLNYSLAVVAKDLRSRLSPGPGQAVAAKPGQEAVASNIGEPIAAAKAQAAAVAEEHY